MTKTQFKLNCLLFSLFAIFVFSASQAFAACTSVNGPYSINTTLTNCYSWGSGDVTVGSSGSITPSDNAQDTFATTSSVGTLTNNGSIYNNSTNSSGKAGIRFANDATGLINNGLIESLNTGNVTVLLEGAKLSTFTNSGQIISNSSTIYTNQATVYVTSLAGAITSGITNFTNTGTGQITNASGVAISLFCNDNAGNYITNFNNDGSISSSIDAIEVNNYGFITTLNNSGTITSSGYGVVGAGINGYISDIINSGTISNTSNVGGDSWWSLNDSGSAIYNGGHMHSITNTGSIYTAASGAFGIYNNTHSNDTLGQIDIINNSQGAGNAHGALTYTGTLPSNYNIIINSPTNYGQLSLKNGVGAMDFGIYTGSTISNNRKYENVLQGLVGTLSGSTITGTGFTITGATGRHYGGYSYALVENGLASLGNWDLCFGRCSSGPLTPDPNDTQDSLNKSASVLRGAFVLQSAAINNNLSNDCTLFDKHGVCTSVTGSQTYVGGGLGNDRTNGTLTVAYRVNDKVRIGGYLDQTLYTGNSTGVNLTNGSPAFGAFVVWNTIADGLGLQVRASAGFADKDMTVTRQVIGTSEAGTGKTGLDSFGAAVVASYAIAMKNNITLSPYVGIRYTKINADAYTEISSDSVTTPLTYSALTQQLTTALLGSKVSKQLGQRTMAYATIGLEQDLNHNDGTYSATGLDSLTPISFNGNSNRTRATASVGTYYNIGERQRIAANLVWSEQAFTSINATSLMATYTHGF